MSTRLFTTSDFEDWRCRVLRLLARKHSRIHDIVDRGGLPIFSLRQNAWFGVRADVRYAGQRCPQGVARAERRRWMLRDFLLSDRAMVPQSRYTLLDHDSSTFLVLYLAADFVLHGSNARTRHARLHINNVYPYHSRCRIPWLRGGDLLFASGVLYALIDVRFMSVCQGPDVQRSIEDQRGAPVPRGYFYYDKFLLVRPYPYQALYENVEPWSDQWDCDEDEYESVDHLLRLPRTAFDSIHCWMWDKKEK